MNICISPDFRKNVALIFRRLPVVCAIVFATQPSRADDSPQAYKWSVSYIIDNSQPVLGRSQKVFPRRNRGLAVSPDFRYLYAGYHHSFNHAGEVRRIDLSEPDSEKATKTVLPGPLGKAIATDSEGRVYIADSRGILVYDAALTRRQLEIPAEAPEGLAVTQEGREPVLYATERGRDTLGRWVLKRDGKAVVDATLAGFDGTGYVQLSGARGLRGVAIDRKGRILIADQEGGKVFRVDRDGKNIVTVDVQSPVAIAIDGARCLVTQSDKRQITILDEEMRVTGTLEVPWEELELTPLGNNHQGAISGIAVVPGKGFYISNEGGQTANQKSTYGRSDDHTDFVNGKLYIDAFSDDNDPILHAVPVSAAPAALK